MGLINPEHSNNTVLKIFSASITSVSSVMLHKEIFVSYHQIFRYRLGHKNHTECTAACAFVMFNSDFIEGISKIPLLVVALV